MPRPRHTRRAVRFQPWGPGDKSTQFRSPEIDPEAFPNKIDPQETYTLYRGIGVRNPADIRVDDIGYHWTYDRDAADQFAREGEIMWGGPGRESDEIPVVLEAHVSGRDVMQWADPANEEFYEEHYVNTPNMEAETTIRPGAEIQGRRIHNLASGETEELLYDRWRTRADGRGGGRGYGE